MMILRAGGAEYPVTAAQKDTDRSWDGRASRAVTLTMPYAQAAALFVDGLQWSLIRREDAPDADTPAAEREWDCSDYCVAGPITDWRDGTVTCKMGTYTQTERALRQLREVLA